MNISGYDEDNGNYIKVLNDHLVYRYQILDVIGKGSFGQVGASVAYTVHVV